jgi:L-rhamnose mutarotase
MKLKPGLDAEYQKRDDEIRPKLSHALTDAGVSDYSIVLDPEAFVIAQELEGVSASAASAGSMA